jgi:hypothetical protein
MKKEENMIENDNINDNIKNYTVPLLYYGAFILILKHALFTHIKIQIHQKP